MQVFSASTKLVLYLIVCDLQSMAWPTLRASMQNYSYEILEPSYMQFNITADESNGHTFNWNVIKYDLKIWVRVLVNFLKNDGSLVTFTDKTFNLCKLLSSNRYEPLIRILYDVLYENSHSIMRRCPIQKKLYYLHVTNFETDKIPPVWPETEIYVKLLYLSKEKDSFRELLRLSTNAKLMKK